MERAAGIICPAEQELLELKRCRADKNSHPANPRESLQSG